MVAKPVLKGKKCEVGSSCKRSCIEKSDTCRNERVGQKASNVANGYSRRVVGAGRKFNDRQQEAMANLTKKAEELFSGDEARQMLRERAANPDNYNEVRLLGDVRHRVGNGAWDKALDDERKASGLDNKEWGAMYKSLSNNVNGLLTKNLLKEKPC